MPDICCSLSRNVVVLEYSLGVGAIRPALDVRDGLWASAAALPYLRWRSKPVIKA
jgi:hypothetical protein